VLDGLLRIPHELVLTESFAFVDHQRALGALALQERQMRSAEDEAWTLRAQLEQARDQVASGQVAFGEHHLTVMLTGDSRAELDGAVSSAVAECTNQGILAVREDLNLEPAFFAQLPGNFAYIGRRALISSANFAGFASFHGFPRGRMEGNHWGSAVTLLETSSATPYAMSFHHGDLGNFTVIGPSGSGKTVVLGFLLAQAQRFAPRTVFFDKDRGAEIALRAMGGTYRLLRPGEPTGMNPLALPDTAANRAFVREWLGLLVRPQDGSALGAQDRAVIAEAVDASYRAAPEFRQLATVQELLRGHERGGPNSLSARLAPWWGSGDRAWLFDHKSDDLSFENPTLGFDLTHLLADPIGRVPALAYLFHRVDGILDGRPMLLFLDEGWRALDDPLFAERLRDWLKTVRKKSGVVGFGSQSASDALGSRIADAIREQCPTQIFLPNPKATAADHCGGFGLSLRELAIVRTLPDTSRAFLLKQGTRSVAARLDLVGLDDLLAVLSGREQTVTLLDAVRAEKGDDPAAWLPVFLERVKGLR
jgi:type IV secretion system protein VirB4